MTLISYGQCIEPAILNNCGSRLWLATLKIRPRITAGFLLRILSDLYLNELTKWPSL